MLEYFEELRVPKGGGDLAVFGEAPVGVCFRDCVHLADELREKLDADDRVLGGSFLQKLEYRRRHVAKRKLIVFPGHVIPASGEYVCFFFLLFFVFCFFLLTTAQQSLRPTNLRTMVQNSLILGHQKSHFPKSLSG